MSSSQAVVVNNAPDGLMRRTDLCYPLCEDADAWRRFTEVWRCEEDNLAADDAVATSVSAGHVHLGFQTHNELFS